MKKSFRAWNKMLVGIPARRMQTIRNLRTDYRTYMLQQYECYALGIFMP